MYSNQALMQCFVAQDALRDVLDRFSRSLDEFKHEFMLEMDQGKHPRLKKLSYTFDQFKKSISKEMQALRAHLPQSLPADCSISNYLQQVLEQAHPVLDSLSQRFQDFNTADQARLAFERVVDRVNQFKTSLSHIDARSLFAQGGDTIDWASLDELGQQSRIQWARKFWHVGAGFGIIAIYLFSLGSFTQKMMVFGGFIAYVFLCDSLRLLFPKFNQMALRELKSMMRKKEANRFNSQTFYSISCFFVCCLFPTPVAILSILYLALGDTVASIVGVYFGKTPLIKNLSVEGTLAFFVTCLGLTFLYPLLDPHFQGNLLLLGVVGGGGCCLS